MCEGSELRGENSGILYSSSGMKQEEGEVVGGGGGVGEGSEGGCGGCRGGGGGHGEGGGDRRDGVVVEEKEVVGRGG